MHTTLAFAKPAAHKAFSLACGHRGGFTGWTPYPHFPARAGLPCGPSLRSGKCLLRARAAHRHPHRPSRGRVALRTHLPDRRPGPGLYAPGLRNRRWGASRLGPRSLPAPPGALPGLGARQPLRAPALRVLTVPPRLGALRARTHAIAFVSSLPYRQQAQATTYAKRTNATSSSSRGL